MKSGIKVAALLVVIFLFVGCGSTIQKTYWAANTGVAVEDEKKGDTEQAEKEFKLALQRARNHLGQKEISDSLYNIGSFYRKQERLPYAIKYLKESLALEESLSGPSSERTGRRMAELAAAYLMEDNFVDGVPLAKRLQGLVDNFTGNELVFVNKVLEAYRGDPAKDAGEVARLTPLAKKGDSKAQYQLANMYMDGKGVTQDFSKAIQLYELSANQGLIEAQHYLGVIYDKGRGTSQDDVKARTWYRLAAEGGSAISQYCYAVLLLQGRGGTQDRESAIEWLKKSANQGYQEAGRVLRSISQSR
jgi:tetratricopeptide (TPR) repeat protein